MGKSSPVLPAILTCILLLFYAGLVSLVLHPPYPEAIFAVDQPDDLSASSNSTLLFQMSDSAEVRELAPVLPAAPPYFGYSEAEGKRIFPDYEYPRCEDKYPPNPHSSVHLDYNRNRLILQCPGPFPGRYVLGPILNVSFTNQYELNERWKTHDYMGPVPLRKDTEFALATCKPRTSHFELMTTDPRYKRKTKYRAMKKATKLGGKRRLIIAMVTLDSFSRNHFFRKLPRVIRWLSDRQKEGQWSVTDFKLHNIIGTDTVENQARIFASKLEEFKESGYRRPDKLGNDAIWAKLRELGFVSLLGFEACAFKMKAFLGRKPTVDHVVNPFYCAAARFASYTSSKYQSHTQRCLGPHMSHAYLMNYTKRFMKQYRGANQWVYNHFTAAHENTGQHAATLDRDLRDYLDAMLRIPDNHTDLVIFLLGDHGMRYGNYKSGTQAVQEHRLPAFFLISPKTYLARIHKGSEVLKHNSVRLTTKPDLRRTILSMANRLYGHPNPEPPGHFIDLFTEKVKNNRTCAGAEIPLWYCATYPLLNIPNYVYNEESPLYESRSQSEEALTDLLFALAKETIVTIGSRVHTPFQQPGLCHKLTFRNLQQANTAYSAPDQQHLFKLTIGVEQNSEVRLDAYIILTSSPSLKVPVAEQEDFPVFPVRYLGRSLYAKVLMVFRLDRYAGYCERAARESELEAEHCLCQVEALARWKKAR
jgi:hypothetical protein